MEKENKAPSAPSRYKGETAHKTPSPSRPAKRADNRDGKSHENRPEKHREENTGSGGGKSGQKNPVEQRQMAVKALDLILSYGMFLDDALGQATKDWKPAPRDAAFVRQLVTLTLRHKGSIDYVMSRLMSRPLPKKADMVANVIRIGLAQIMVMRTADHAAVDTAVSIVKKNRKPFIRQLSGLTNAILRRAIRERDEQWAKATRDMSHNIPKWLKSRWSEAWGVDTTSEITASQMMPTPLDIMVKNDGDHTDLLKELNGTSLLPNHIRLTHEQMTDANGIFNIAGFEEGKWWVQDIAATLPVRLLGDVEGKNVLDLCAAPGGKTLQLAALGANVTAVDVSIKRLELLRANLKRTNQKSAVSVVTKDVFGLQLEADDAPDMILLDAPCSATGTFRRHVEGPWIKSRENIRELVPVQRDMMEKAYGWLKPGGLMMYCVCSLEREEGEGQLAEFLENNPATKILPVTAKELPGFEAAIQADGSLRTLPHMMAEKGGMDGFFIARIQKPE
jgi:16S rRNA (cytosine967-C5)-methyltransferase